MNRFRRRCCILMLLICLLSIAGCGESVPGETAETLAIDPEIAALSDEVYFRDVFTPALRFVVCSDVHIDDVGTELEQERFARMCETAYAYAKAQGDGVPISGIFVAGDISESGTLVSMQKFFRLAGGCLQGDTVLRACLGNHEFYNEDTEALFLVASGYDAVDSHLTASGYHFILVSPDENGKGYSKAKQKWLKEQLQQAAAEDPTGARPIFVFQHHHVSNTVYGSVRWGTEDLRKVLDQYPQAVDFSGHSHFPINDPTSVWQGTFTALGTGTLSYSEVGIAGFCPDSVWAVGTEGDYTTTEPWESGQEKNKDTAQFYIVEVDARYALRIQGYDLLSDSFFMDPILLRSVGDPAQFVYTEDRAEKSEAPVFAEDAEIRIEELHPDFVKLRFPQASCPDNVQNYRCELWQDDTLLSTEYRLSCTCYTPAPESLTVSFGLPEAGGFRVELYPVNSYGKASEEPLCIEVTP